MSKAFMRGFSRGLDLGANQKRTSNILQKSDKDKLRDDWRAVGGDIGVGFDKVRTGAPANRK